MHPFLWQTQSLEVRAYPCMVLAAAILVVGTLALRSAGRDLNQGVLVRTLMLAILGGWVGGRVLPVLVAGGFGRFTWSLLLPTRAAGQSLSCFLVVAFPVALLSLARRRGPVLAYLDAITPSLLLALAVLKIGCLLAGCCFGRPCAAGWGLRYPYGSNAYRHQYQQGLIDPPAALVRLDDEGRRQLLAHSHKLAYLSRNPPKGLLEHAREQGLSVGDLQALAAAQRSLPVWPVPIWYVAGAALAWVAAEIIFRRTRRAGWTMGFVLVSYAAMRLGFDGFVEDLGRPLPGITDSQLYALPVLAIGAGILVWRVVRRDKAVAPTGDEHQYTAVGDVAGEQPKEEKG